MSKKNECIIFGSSPFINTLDIPALCADYYTIGINKFPVHHRVDCAIQYDEPIHYPVLPPEIWAPFHWRPDERSEFDNVYVVLTGEEHPVYGKKLNIHGARHVAMRYFTASIAANIAIWKGLDAIYLVGVDHKESDTHFDHFYPEDPNPDVMFCREAHQALKQFILECSHFTPIFQTNPEVAHEWPVPYKDINELYDQISTSE